LKRFLSVVIILTIVERERGGRRERGRERRKEKKKERREKRELHGKPQLQSRSSSILASNGVRKKV